MACMCGDVMCPSCGPAQGYNPTFEVVREWLECHVLADMPEVVNVSWLAEDLANRLSREGQELIDAVAAEAKNWARKLSKETR